MGVGVDVAAWAGAPRIRWEAAKSGEEEGWGSGSIATHPPAPQRLGGHAWALLFVLHTSLPSSLPRLCGLAGPWVCLSLLGGVQGSAWLFHTLRSVSPAPSLEHAKASGRGAESPLFLDRPDFFDYPDSDQAKLLAVAQFIGEKPVIFANSGMTQLEKGLPSWPGPRGWLPLALRLEASPGSPVSPSLSSRF